MKIGILGGTFDPIQIAHLLGAEMVWDTLKLDQILFLPAGDPPHKQHQQHTPTHHRLAMVELAIANNTHFVLCRIDLDRKGPHYTNETIRLIRQQYHLTETECFFIIGGDSLVDLPTWHQPRDFVSLCQLAVLHRPGYHPDLTTLTTAIPKLPERLHWVAMPQLDIAASTIRKRARSGQSIRYQVTDPVWHYIQEHQLYQD